MMVPRITESYEYCITFPRSFAEDCTLQPFQEKAAEYTFFVENMIYKDRHIRIIFFRFLPSGSRQNILLEAWGSAW